MLEMLILDWYLEVLCELHSETTVDDLDSGEAKVKADVFVVLNQVNNSQEYRVQSIVDNFSPKKACSCDGNWIAVDHAEALLEDWVLALSRQDFLLALVMNKMLLEAWVNNEAGSDMMDVTSLKPMLV